jgi:hypothetical protein
MRATAIIAVVSGLASNHLFEPFGRRLSVGALSFLRFGTLAKG